ncbi:nucleoporin NSP1-like [Tripterygium wilfordii]|uniref:nucleoporin NSP1-like n=1 Tax=Tripterygium wilfordii TaxID=458696 RepID=UPI0018F7EC5E|nr:nucleoporin NSP1-like [Tripterygium wilfordii]
MSGFSFGSSASAFGSSQSSSSLFGAAASFGSSLFGAATPTSGSASNTSMASSAPSFGAFSSAETFAPAFGTPSSAASSGSNFFGTTSSAASSGSNFFGTTSSTASSGSSFFGTTSSTASSGSSFFATPSSAASSGSSLFGAPSSAACSGSTLFGAPSSAASSGSTLFGTPSSAESSGSTLFGTPSSAKPDAPVAVLEAVTTTVALTPPASSTTFTSSAATSGLAVPAFGVSSSSSATTDSSVAAPASAAAASGAVSSSMRFGLSSTSASSTSTGSFTGFQLSTKTSAAASSSQAQLTSASPVFEVKRSYKRDLPPAHFMFKIESFSLLSEAEVEKYETGVFEVGDYKWSLIFYPNGKKNANADNHISLYLAIKETEKLPACWEVNATFKFFVFDHIRDKYLTIEGCKGSMKRFNAIKTEWGFAEFISLESLKNASTGYLVEDSCIFGAEVFVVKSSCKFECLSMIKHTSNNLMTWKIEDFSKLDKEYYESEVFDVKGSKWKLTLYPKGHRIAKGKSLSLYLCLNEAVSLAPSQKFFAHYKLRIRNQIQDSDHAERIGKRWFDHSATSWGFREFISLQDLEKQVKGIIMNDCLMVEAEILYESEVKSLS